MMWYRLIRWWIAALCCVVACSRPSQAEPIENDEPAPTVIHENQYDIYQAAVTLYRAKRYQEAVGKFRLAYELHPLPGILLNTANALRHLAQGAEPGRMRFVAARAIGYFDRYLREEQAPPVCSVMRQRAFAQHLFDGKVFGLAEPVHAVESVDALRAAYQKNGNAGLLRCIAHAHLDYARELKVPITQSTQARLALAAYQEYQTARSAAGQARDPLIREEQVDAMVLLSSALAQPAGSVEEPAASSMQPVVVD